MRVLVTGGAGFIGSHLSEALLWRGDSVVVLDDLSSGSLEKLRLLEGRGGFRFIHGRIGDPEAVDRAVKGVDLVIHLAAVPGAAPERSEANAEGTANVLDAAARWGRPMLMTTTSNVSTPERDAKDERMAKLLAEDRPSPLSVVRFRNVIGPRQSIGYAKVVPRFIRQALRGEDLTVHGDGSQTRSFVYIDDVVEGMLSLIDRGTGEGEVFTFGSTERIAIIELAKRILEVTESSSEITFVEPPEVDVHRAMPRHPVPDVSRAAELLGFSPAWPLNDSLAAIAATFLGRPITPPVPDGVVEELLAAPQPVAEPEPEAPAPENSMVEPETRPPLEPAPNPEPAPVPEAVTEPVPAVPQRPARPAPPPPAPRPIVSVIVPVYNEARSIGECIRRLRALSQIDELIVVNDGSDDGTGDELARVAGMVDIIVDLPKNCGKGAAVKAGVARSRGDILVFHDSDLELDPADIPRLIEPIVQGRAQVVTGNRIHPGNRNQVPPRQWIINRSLTMFANAVYGALIGDVATGSRAITRALWKALEVESDRFDFDSELQAKVVRAKADSLEVPILFRPRAKRQGKKIKWTDGIKAGRALLRFRLWKPRMRWRTHAAVAVTAEPFRLGATSAGREVSPVVFPDEKLPPPLMMPSKPARGEPAAPPFVIPLYLRGGKLSRESSRPKRWAPAKDAGRETRSKGPDDETR